MEYFSNDFPCPMWGQWSPTGSCLKSCSKMREVISNQGLVTKVYPARQMMAETRICLNEQNHYSCKDYANDNGDQNQYKSQDFRQDHACNNKICPGKS